MDEGLRKEFRIAGPNAEYDEYAKRLLAHKIVLAQILVSAVAEFKGIRPEEAVQLIEGEPEVASVSVNPGETNRKTEVMPVITGQNLESKIPEEGTITYDVRFYVWIPNKREKIKIIVDIEAQKKANPNYDIVARGIFYGARLISSQLGTEFKIPNYDAIKKVYSIWICMNAPKKTENTAIEYCIKPNSVIGTIKSYGKYDLLSVIKINLSRQLAGEKDELKLHRFLGVLFETKLSAIEKTEILSSEFGIQVTEELEGRLNIMCNLSEAIEEQAMEKGMEKGIAEGMERGQLQQLYDLVQSGDITIERAAEKKSLTVKQFQNKLREYGLI